MRILVTGGAGYIGSTVSNLLVSSGFKTEVLDNLSNGHLQAISPGAHFHKGNVGDQELLDRILPGVDAVMHFAASIEVGHSMQQPIEHFQNNTANTIGLLSAMLRHGVKKLVFSSTAALYGSSALVPIVESSPLCPTSPYGESKLMVEKALSWLNLQNGFSYASLRYFNAAGGSTDRGEDHRPETHLIPIVLEVARGKRPYLEIFGTDYPTIDGTAVRDYVHVEDLASAHLLALRALEGRDKLIYNLGNGQGFSVLQVVEAARRVVGHPIPILKGARRQGDPAKLVASSEAIRSELGWKPRYAELEEIIESAWKWHSTHPEGYAS